MAVLAWQHRMVPPASQAGAGAAKFTPAGSPAILADASNPAMFADASNPAVVSQGRELYASHCAACHGKRLQGQAMWQADDEDSWRRAPALDATGNAWQHGDAALAAMVASGRYPGVPPGARSAMPAFGGRLSAAEIFATLAYIKQHWPVALRVVQAALNPGHAGMPQAGAWRFPVMCKAVN